MRTSCGGRSRHASILRFAYSAAHSCSSWIGVRMIDHMDDGLVPFESCILNVVTGARIEYADTRDKYKLTKKVPYDYDASKRCDEASQFLRERIIKRLYPEEALRLEVMKRR